VTGAAGRADGEVDATSTGDATPDPFEPGTNLLVEGGRAGEALEYCLSRLTEGPGPVAVVSTDLPASTVTGTLPATRDGGDGARRPLVRVVDCTGRAPDVDDLDVPAGARVDVASRDLPAVGEAAVAALGDGPEPPAAGLCLDSVSTLVERATVQGVYKLLYVLARQVRARGAVACYTWDGPAAGKTARILGRALDYRLSLDASDGPAVRTLAGRSGGDG
jgi:hypothetical protein